MNLQEHIIKCHEENMPYWMTRDWLLQFFTTDLRERDYVRCIKLAQANITHRINFDYMEPRT